MKIIKFILLHLPIVKRYVNKYYFALAERDAYFLTCIKNQKLRYKFISDQYRLILENQKLPTNESKLNQNIESFVPYDKTGASAAAYKKTYNFDGQFINDTHKSYNDAPTDDGGVCVDLGVEGWLQKSDALKLYELAYFSKGNILELGTHQGLSASIMAAGLSDAGSNSIIETVDIDQESVSIGENYVAGRSGAEKINFNLGDATEFLIKLIADRRMFSFVFIDHWHGYRSVFDAAMMTKKILMKGGFVCFHDYNDSRNPEPTTIDEYGVYQAVADAVMTDHNFMFFGVFGCCGLFRKIGD